MDKELAGARERLIAAHVQAENDRDLDAVMATFGHPRYEHVSTGQVFDGEDEVRALLTAQWEQLPSDMRWEALGFYHGTDGVMVETRTLGTAASSNPIDFVTVNLFGFEGSSLILERCWFDRLTAAEQLGAIELPTA